MGPQSATNTVAGPFARAARDRGVAGEIRLTPSHWLRRMHKTVYARPTLCPTLIGREQEMAVVEQAVESAHNGRGSSILLLGEAGVGKSRLAREASSLGQQRRMLDV